jgi:hypothetical protein
MKGSEMTSVAEELFVDLAMAKLGIDNGGTMTYALVDKHDDWSTRTTTMNVNSIRLLHLDNTKVVKLIDTDTQEIFARNKLISATSDSPLRSYHKHASTSNPEDYMSGCAHLIKPLMPTSRLR